MTYVGSAAIPARPSRQAVLGAVVAKYGAGIAWEERMRILVRRLRVRLRVGVWGGERRSRKGNDSGEDDEAHLEQEANGLLGCVRGILRRILRLKDNTSTP